MQLCAVAPLAGAWIEIVEAAKELKSIDVAPLAGAWIEIYLFAGSYPAGSLSLPSRERGLKYNNQLCIDIINLSLPSRERGLK